VRLADLFGFDRAENIKHELLADLVENMSAMNLGEFYNNLHGIYERGKEEQQAKLRAEWKRQNARAKEIIQGIKDNSKNNIFRFATDDLEYADIQTAEKALMASNFDEGERDRLREVIRRASVRWGKIKRDFILKELPPQMIHKMLDDKHDTLLSLFRDAIETPDNARQELIQRASKPFYTAYKALYEAKDAPGVGKKIMLDGRPFSAEQAVLLTLYREQEHTAELLARNNDPEAKDWLHIDPGLRAERYKNRITAAELDRLVNIVETTPLLKAVKDAAQQAFEVNKELLKDAAENTLNMLFEEQDNYFPYKLVRAGAENEQEFTDLIGRVWQSQTGSLRSGNLERRVKHRRAVNWANASLTGMINHAVANQARIIAYAQAARDYTRIMGQVKPVIDRRGGNTAITAELKTFGADIFYGNENNYQGVDAWLAKFRSRIYPSALAWNIRTPFRQVLGLFTAIAQSDLKTITAGLRLAVHGDNWKKAYSKSAVLRNSTIDQYYAEAMWAKETTAAPNMLVSAWRKFWEWGLKPLEVSDRAVRVAAWMGAYDKAIKAGQTEQEAVAAGDYLVSTTQNMSGKIYQPALMRSSQWTKTFFMYGSQAFQQFGVYMNLLNRLRNGSLSKKDFGLGVFWLFLMGWLFNRIISNAGKRGIWKPSSYLLKKHPIVDITTDMLSFAADPTLAKWVDTARFGGEITSSLPGEILSSASGILRNSLTGEFKKAGLETLKTSAAYYGGNPRLLSQFVWKGAKSW
jgi:hypothetical protein